MRFRALLLYRVRPTCFADLRTIDGVEYQTYTEAAVKLGLFASDEIFEKSMNDAINENASFRKLQRYFALMIYHGKPSNPQALFDKFLDKMNPPRSGDHISNPKSRETRRAEVMRNLEYYLNCLNTTSRCV